MLPKSVQNLIDEFSKLPGIGPKSAQRLVMHLLHLPDSYHQRLGNAVIQMKESVIFCPKCWHLAEESGCAICENLYRDPHTICVVEDVMDVLAIEKTMNYKGLYHVLHGSLSPLRGIGPDELKIPELFSRVKSSLESDGKLEIILATNPGLEGESTAMYIQNELQHLPVKITRIARGLPIGADLDYADQDTIIKALEGRREY